MPTATSDVRMVLVVAAETFELKHIRPREGENWVLKANGPGPVLAGEAADNAGRPDVVLSVGLCGALADELQVGDIVVGTAVNGIAIDAPSTQGRFAAGPIVSIDRVAQTVGEKRKLRETGAIAVEMEAAAVLERARRWNVPFYCIRAVSDTADEGFALDLNGARDSAGRFSAGRIVMQAVRRPVSGIPALVRMGRNAGVAIRALGEFIGNCRF